MTTPDVKFTLRVRGVDHKPLKNFPIRVQYLGKTKQLERMTDQQGKATFSLQPDQSIDVLVLSPNGSFAKNATINTTQASRKACTIIGVGHKKSDFVVQLQIQMIDLDKRPVANHNLEILLEGNTLHKKSDQSGIISQTMLVGEQIRMNCVDLESNLTLVERFKKTLHVDEYPSSYIYTPNRAGDQPITIKLPMHIHDSSTEPDKPTTQHPPLTPPSLCPCEQLFAQVAPIILKHEGGWVNDPNDSGGATNRGITIGTFNTYAKEDLGIDPTIENLKKLTDGQATIIYRKRYWEPKGYCKFKNSTVALMIYDWSITSGGAIMKVQKLINSEYSVGLVEDGGMGDRTINAINSIADQQRLLQQIATTRKQYYTSLAVRNGEKTKNYKFLKGWLNRVDDCLKIKLGS